MAHTFGPQYSRQLKPGLWVRNSIAGSKMQIPVILGIPALLASRSTVNSLQPH